MFKKRQSNFQEERENILLELQKRESELQNRWLHNSDQYLSITNSFGEGDLESLRDNKRRFKTLIASFFRLTLSNISGRVSWINYRNIGVLKELKEIEKRRKEIEDAKEYFKKVEDSEEDYQRNRAKELLPWSEQIVNYSLQVLPFKKYREIEEQKKRDPYLQLLHWYAFFISFFLTGGLILFYLLYKKSRNPRYKFLESPLSKHVLEQKRFEEYLSEIVRRKTSFDSLDNLKYCFSNTFSDLSYNSAIESKLMRSPLLKSIFLIVASILTGGFLPMYIYILSSDLRRDNFYRWWMSRKNIERERVEELGNISRKWWGRGVKALRKIWSDYHFTSYLAGLTNSIIARDFLSPNWKAKKLNYSLFWMYLMPRPRWFINLLLLAVGYAFFSIWISTVMGNLSLSHYSFPIFVSCFTLFLFLFGYHILLII